MTESDQESTSNTDDLISGVYRLEDISPLLSPRSPEAKHAWAQQVLNEAKGSGKGSTSGTPQSSCFDKSNSNTVQAHPASPRSRSLSPQGRIRVHYTDSAREALDLANKSYEKLVEESDERHKLSILINKRDAESLEKEKEEQKRAEVAQQGKANVKPPEVSSQTSQTDTRKEKLPTHPITIIQEHIKFAESILASPPSSEAGERSRSLSPSISHHRTASPSFLNPPGTRSRSKSPLARSSTGNPVSSRKRLAFEGGEGRSRSPLLSRCGREKTAQQIRTQATNDYIEATSQGFHHPHLRTTAQKMSATQSAHPDSSRDNGSEFIDIYTTPDKRDDMHVGLVSSTPHAPGHRVPLRDISTGRPQKSRHISDATSMVSSTEPAHTPNNYIRGLQSVRSGLRRLMGEELAAVEDADSRTNPDNVGLRIESTINTENQLLRDQLGRERSLRKQIDADKHELQAQLLESKDRLHHLSSTLKQKDGMMKKLDQNLEDVVKGWQKHEQDNKYKNEALHRSIQRLERELDDQKRYASGLENDLSNAIDDLRRERDTSRDYAREASEQQLRYQEDLVDIKNCLEKEEEKSLRLELENTHVTEGRAHVEEQLDALQETLDLERDNFKDREQELLNKINEITSVQIAVLEQEAARTMALNEKIEELDDKARKFENDAETQRHLVSTKVKELERLQSLVELTDAKHENTLRQLESKLRIELELRISQARDDGLKRLADNEIALQQAHQRQLSHVVADHNRQLGAMRERFNNEINRIKSHMEEEIRSTESALQDTRHELEAAQALKEAAENTRDDLASRLQAVLNLLGTAAGNQGFQLPFQTRAPPISSDYGSSVTLSHQPSTTDIAHAPQVFAPNKSETMDELTATSLPDKNTKSSSYKEAPSVHTDSADTSACTDNGPLEPPSADVANQQPGQFEQHRQQLEDGDKTEKDDGEDENDSASVESTTETYDLNDNDDSLYRHKRQTELQDYIKKLLNRSVGDPLIETRIDLDESHISVISGLQDHSVILHDGTHHHVHSPKKPLHHEMVGQTPPVKGSSKKVNPKEIASLISKDGSDSATPSTTEYIEYLKSVAVNNHTDLLKEFDRRAKPTEGKGTAKRALTQSFVSSTSSRGSPHKRTTSKPRVTPSSPNGTALSRQAKEKDPAKVKRHSSRRTQAIWK